MMQTKHKLSHTSGERFIQKGGDTTNSNVAKMKKTFFVDIPKAQVMEPKKNMKETKRTGAKMLAEQPSQDNTTAKCKICW